MRRIGTIVGIVALAVMVFPQSAAAGGSLMEWDRPYYYPGETAVGRAPVWTKTTFDGAGRPEDGPYKVYLRPLSAGDDYVRGDPALDPAAIHLGELVIDHDPAQTHGIAHFQFIVPEVPSDRYYVDHCNSDCSLQLGDLIDTTITIVNDEGQERRLIDRRIETLDRTTGTTFFHLRERISALEGDVAGLTGAMTQVKNELGTLRDQLKKSRQRQSSAVPTSASMLAAFGGLGLAAVLVLRARHRSDL